MLALLLTFFAFAHVAHVPDPVASRRVVQDEPRPLELTEAEFRSIWERIEPDAEEEAWRTIPWRTTFWQGVVDANELDRPVLLFAMNGHPFGCT
ncbi:MAG: hypothetical protein R3F34_07780 [Planctomycetota bacterium]